ncbi:MAG: hypothetical protein ACXQS8_09025 [Candidatus Helarchaeales archaeon]
MEGSDDIIFVMTFLVILVLFLTVLFFRGTRSIMVDLVFRRR